MHDDYEWNARDYRAIWVSYEIWNDERAKPIRTAKSTATIDELKRQVGVAPARS